MLFIWECKYLYNKYKLNYSHKQTVFYYCYLFFSFYHPGSSIQISGKGSLTPLQLQQIQQIRQTQHTSLTKQRLQSDHLKAHLKRSNLMSTSNVSPGLPVTTLNPNSLSSVQPVISKTPLPVTSFKNINNCFKKNLNKNS